MTDQHDWEWLGEPLAVDFANTVRRRGATLVELLRSGEDLATWAARQTGRVPTVSATDADQRLDEVQATRDDVIALLHAAAGERALPAGARLRVNRLAVAATEVLGERPGETEVTVADGLRGLDELLARVARATVALVGQGPESGLAFCDAPSCGQFFIRERPNQRWCGPACGTRARVARHAAHRGSAG